MDFESQKDFFYKLAAEEADGEVLGLYLVEKKHNRRGFAKRILSITTQEIGYFKILKKSVEKSRTYAWRDLRDYKKEDGLIKLFFYGENIIQFRADENMNEIAAKIEQLLSVILTHEQLEEKNVCELISANQKQKTAFTQYIQYESLFLDSSIETDDMPFKYIRMLLNRESDSIRFDYMKNAEALIPLFLTAVGENPMIKELIINTNNSAHVVKKVAKAVQNHLYDRIEHLHIRNSIGANLGRFLNGVGFHMNSSIKSISFTDTKFTVLNLTDIADFVQSHDILSLKFENAMYEQTSVDDFLDIIFEKGNYENLKMFAANSFQDFPIFNFYKKFFNLTTLSLCNCNIDVIVAINICATHLPRLRAINLSNNQCYGSVSATIESLGNLTRIDCRQVEYEVGGFNALIEGLFSAEYKYPLNLSLSLTEPNYDDGDSWEKMSQSFIKANGERLESLDWSYQKLTKELIQFLETCKNLKKLLLHCVSITETPELIKPLAKALQKLPKLEILDFSDVYKPEHIEQHKIEPIIDILPKIKTLKWLNIKNHYIGDDNLLKLKPLLQYIDTIGIDGSNISSIDVLQSFISDLDNREKGINIDWPNDDLYHLPIPQHSEEIQLLKYKFRKLRKIPNDGLKEPIKHETFKYNWQYPIDSYYYPLNRIDETFFVRYDNHFPSYWCKEVEDMILDDSEIGEEVIERHRKSMFASSDEAVPTDPEEPDLSSDSSIPSFMKEDPNLKELVSVKNSLLVSELISEAEDPDVKAFLTSIHLSTISRRQASSFTAPPQLFEEEEEKTEQLIDSGQYISSKRIQRGKEKSEKKEKIEKSITDNLEMIKLHVQKRSERRKSQDLDDIDDNQIMVLKKSLSSTQFDIPTAIYIPPKWTNPLSLPCVSSKRFVDKINNKFSLQRIITYLDTEDCDD